MSQQVVRIPRPKRSEGHVPPRPGPADRTGRFRWLRPGPWISIAVIVVVLAAWQLGAEWKLFDPQLFTSPSRVAQAAWEMARSGNLGSDAVSTFTALGLATASAIVIGELAGLAMGRISRLRYMFEWLFVVLNSMPRLAFIPIVIVAIGIGVTSNTLIGFISAVVPIALFVTTGVRQTPDTLVQVAVSLDLSAPRMWWKIFLPVSLPYLISGLRLGFSRALVGVIVAEMFNPIRGLGRWIASGRTSLDPSTLVAAAFIVGVAGAVVMQLLAVVEKRLVH